MNDKNTIKLNGVDINIDDLTLQLKNAGYDVDLKKEELEYDSVDYDKRTGKCSMGGYATYSNFDRLLADVLRVLNLIKNNDPEYFKRMSTNSYNVGMTETNDVICNMDPIVPAMLMKFMLGKMNFSDRSKYKLSAYSDVIFSIQNKLGVDDF